MAELIMVAHATKKAEVFLGFFCSKINNHLFLQQSIIFLNFVANKNE